MARLGSNSSLPAQINSVVNGNSIEVLQSMPSNCISLIVTSPPYWDIVDYEVEGQIGHSSYDEYLDDLLRVWVECERILIPNGKLAIVSPVMPIAKSVIGDQHTRHLKNISADIDAMILANIDGLLRYSLFVWQKQTSTKMFGSYPYPPNIMEDNTIEFISVFVKAGKPIKVDREVKEHNRLSKDEWLNLTMQVWNVYPETSQRVNHPAPFPVAIPQRLIKMYTFGGLDSADFDGDIVLDPFCGSGTTCVAAKSMGRQYIGIELNSSYCSVASNRIQYENPDPNLIRLNTHKIESPKPMVSIVDMLQH